MIDKEYAFVLGARDPEMREIVELLGQHDRAFVHAACAGFPVSPRSAYAADGVVRLSRSGRAAPALLVPGVYGNPHRGYAGAYIH